MADKWVSFDCFGTPMDWQTGFRRVAAQVAGDRADALMDAYHKAEHATEAEAPTRPYRDVLLHRPHPRHGQPAWRPAGVRGAGVAVALEGHDTETPKPSRPGPRSPVLPFVHSPQRA